MGKWPPYSSAMYAENNNLLDIQRLERHSKKSILRDAQKDPISTLKGLKINQVRIATDQII